EDARDAHEPGAEGHVAERAFEPRRRRPRGPAHRDRPGGERDPGRRARDGTHVPDEPAPVFAHSSAPPLTIVRSGRFGRGAKPSRRGTPISGRPNDVTRVETGTGDRDLSSSSSSNVDGGAV